MAAESHIAAEQHSAMTSAEQHSAMTSTIYQTDGDHQKPTPIDFVSCLNDHISMLSGEFIWSPCVQSNLQFNVYPVHALYKTCARETAYTAVKFLLYSGVLGM